MKKIVSVLLILLMFSLSACKKENTTSSKLDTNVQSDISSMGASIESSTASEENSVTTPSMNAEIKQLIKDELSKIEVSKGQTTIDEQKLINDITNNVLEQLSNRDKFVVGEEVSSLFGTEFDFPFDSYYNSKGLNETAKIKSFKIVKLSENTNRNYREWEEIGGGVKFVRYKYKVSVTGEVNKKHSGSKIQIWLSEDDFAEYSNYSPRVIINTDGSFSIEWISCSNKNINQTAIENIFVDSKEDEVT